MSTGNLLLQLQATYGILRVFCHGLGNMPSRDEWQYPQWFHTTEIEVKCLHLSTNFKTLQIHLIGTKFVAMYLPLMFKRTHEINYQIARLSSIGLTLTIVSSGVKMPTLIFRHQDMNPFVFVLRARCSEEVYSPR